MRTVPLTIEGVDFVVAPTPISKLAKARLLFGDLAGRESEEGVDALIEAVFWGAKRAGSAITLDWLKMNVDAHNILEVQGVFIALNVPKGAASEPAAGEAQAAATP